MKFSKLFLASVLCSAIAVLPHSTAYADDPVLISDSMEESQNVSSINTGLDTPLSPGLNVISYDDPIIISESTGKHFYFSAVAFDDHYGYVPSAIQLISLPEEGNGKLIYDSAPAAVGQSVSVLSLSSLYYEPSSTDDSEFIFSPDNKTISRCIFRQKDGSNSPPSAYGDESVTTYTKLNTVVGGYLNGVDPDGDSINFEIVKYPSKGILSLKNDENGFYTYSPYSGMSGTDSFSYRISDSYGAYSKTYTNDIIIENRSAIDYSDMQDSFYTSAVTDVTRSGVMQTHKTAEGELFLPDEPVSRIDFLIMAMKSMGAGEAPLISSTPFADDASLSMSEKGYLSAAYDLGIVKGSYYGDKLVFMPDEAIDGAAAATILNGILGLPENSEISVFALDDDVPAWAIPQTRALTNAGILNKHIAPANELLTRENVAVILSGIMKKLA